MNAEDATRDVLENQLPAVKKEIESGKLKVDNIDVFCEKGVFDLDQTERILKAGAEIGLRINFHGDELHPMKSAEVRKVKDFFTIYVELLHCQNLKSSCLHCCCRRCCCSLPDPFRGMGA